MSPLCYRLNLLLCHLCVCVVLHDNVFILCVHKVVVLLIFLLLVGMLCMSMHTC